VLDATVPAHIRLGLIVGKRQVKLASGRNLIKRAAREAFRQHALAQLSIGGGLVVRLAKPARNSPVAAYSASALRLIYRQELEQAFTQLLNRICNKSLANLSNTEALTVKNAVKNSLQHSVQKAT
jgi:ribonuclease P protein component